MTTGQGPTTTRRRLRAELSSLRLAKGMSIEAVTNEVEWSTSKLIRIEGGQVGISVTDLNALLAVYGVADQAHIEELRALARATRQRMWWSAYQRHIPASYLEFIGAEFDAKQIRHYHPTTVPGLLQTPAYASAIIEATTLEPLSPEVAKARNEVRLQRQEQVLNRADPPAFTVILDEAVLRRPVGGQATMREQLDHLIRMAERDTITMVVVPFSAGPHPGLMGAFALMEYNDPLNDDVLCLEQASGDLFVKDQPELVALYRKAVETLEKIGKLEPEAIQFVQQVRNELR
jgi:transcriptional regulator with XRE-family HTH domain